MNVNQKPVVYLDTAFVNAAAAAAHDGGRWPAEACS
jgi:hypothetical protein